MSDFVVVSKTSANDSGYDTAVVFTGDGDNEKAANEFLAEKRAAAPWQSHSVVSREDFDKAAESASAAETPAPSDPAPTA